MSELTPVLMDLFRQYSSLVLAGVLFLHALGLPSSAGLLVMAAGAFASMGDFDIISLFLQVWLFIALADSFAYWLWRRFGKQIFSSFPRLDLFFQPKLAKVDDLFSQRGKILILLTRFPLSALSSLTNAAAGLMEFGFPSFLSMVIAGELLWVTAYLGLGYWFGDAWETVYTLLSEFGLLILFVVLLLCVILFSYRWLYKRKSSIEKV